VIAQLVRGLYRFVKRGPVAQYTGYFVMPRADAMKLEAASRSCSLLIEQGPTLNIDIDVSDVAFHTKLAHAGFVSHGPAVRMAAADRPEPP
jgi:hypothetical protein